MKFIENNKIYFSALYSFHCSSWALLPNRIAYEVLGCPKCTVLFSNIEFIETKCSSYLCLR